ncbi:NUDIX hydrolase [Lactobacillus sp. ESL0791]|uniref:NUDIX hydrolase n=1 Tax=Lactobacillus sp. ESL0791 TaxID=2983234 RepID=UPI0023F7BB14|nr:NUDIX hydrolase [Lactobacillus sp. ESL0791]MDF7639090.1 NUDIX hydrolase [Lactobacillus sp. ESL0791]
MTEKFHRAFGVYGILTTQKGLVVIKKHGGPYTNRFDLPGGSLEDGEELAKAIVREFKEETGLTATSLTQLGTTSFRYPWDYKQWHFNQHIAVFYLVTKTLGTIEETARQFSGQDSLGAVELSLADLNLSNSSPLVLKAKEYLLTQKFSLQDQTYQEWNVLQKPMF